MMKTHIFIVINFLASVSYGFEDCMALLSSSALSEQERKQYSGVLRYAEEKHEGRHGGQIIETRLREGVHEKPKTQLTNTEEQFPSQLQRLFLDKETIQFWGYGSFGATEMIPDRIELNTAWRKVAEKLNFSPIQYKEIYGLYSAKEYLYDFGYLSLHPVARGGHAFYHDVLLHGMLNLIPRVYIEQAQARARQMYNFIEWATKRNSIQKNEFEKVMTTATRLIDFGNAYAVQAMFEKNPEKLIQAIQYFTMEDLSEADYLHALIQPSKGIQEFAQFQFSPSSELLIALTEYSETVMSSDKRTQDKTEFYEISQIINEVFKHVQNVELAAK